MTTCFYCILFHFILFHYFLFYSPLQSEWVQSVFDGRVEGVGGSKMSADTLLEETLIKRSQQKRLTSPLNYKERVFVLTKTKLTYYEFRAEVRLYRHIPFPVRWRHGCLWTGPISFMSPVSYTSNSTMYR